MRFIDCRGTLRVKQTSPEQAWSDFSRCLQAFPLPEQDGSCFIQAMWERDLETPMQCSCSAQHE